MTVVQPLCQRVPRVLTKFPCMAEVQPFSQRESGELTKLPCMTVVQPLSQRVSCALTNLYWLRCSFSPNNETEFTGGTYDLETVLHELLLQVIAYKKGVLYKRPTARHP